MRRAASSSSVPPTPDARSTPLRGARARPVGCAGRTKLLGHHDRRCCHACNVIEIYAQDRTTIEEFEATVASYEEMIEFRRMYRSPHYFARIAVADNVAYEAFVMDKLTGHPAVQRLESRLTMRSGRRSRPVGGSGREPG
ncbi:Lrp/AsnC ligand binding domain-containing protein [Streptomyces sp. NPDC051218]|uniref:Lrp/AsnC ligand binding domain-containing protein n=1 Tax=Streptomyces sp. NPDC051218 TaxID=3365645 RepID=UPI003796E293